MESLELVFLDFSSESGYGGLCFSGNCFLGVIPNFRLLLATESQLLMDKREFGAGFCRAQKRHTLYFKLIHAISDQFKHINTSKKYIVTKGDVTRFTLMNSVALN